MAGQEKATHLAEITKQAAQIASLVPEHLQEAAFNRAFDQLSGDSPGRTADTGGGRTTRRRARTQRSQSEVDDGPAATLIDSLDRTAHPEIGQAVRALDRALHLLRIAANEYEVDGMTASQIATVLTEKFRLRVSRQAIGQALDAAGDYVDRRRGRKGAVYRLMQPGEDYLDAGGAAVLEEPSSKARPRRGASTSTRRSRTRRKGGVKSESQGSTSTGSKARRRGRGPKALVEALISEGFFDEPRVISDIQDRLRHKQGVQLKPTDLSPTLVRLLREHKLDRDRNESNQYEYRVRS